MSTRFVQALVLASFFIIPSTVLANGLPESDSDGAESAETETVPLQQNEENKAQSLQQNNSDENEKNSSILGMVAETVGNTVKSVVKPIINVDTEGQDHAEDESLLNVSLSEKPSIKVDAKIAEVEVSETISVKTPVANTEIGESVKLETPVADVNVSDTISIKTPIAQADVDASIKAGGTSKENNHESGPSDSVAVTEPPNANSENDVTDSADVTYPESHTEVPKEQTNEKPVTVPEEPAETITPVITEADDDQVELKKETDISFEEDIKNSLEADSLKNAADDQVLIEQNISENENKNEEAFIKVPFDDHAVQKAADKPFHQPAIIVQANHGSNSSITISASGGQSLSGGASFPSLYFADLALLGEWSGVLSYHGNVAFFYDQWLNAPPSQPPQPSFFSYVFI